jgi:hypothetical protein
MDRIYAAISHIYNWFIPLIWWWCELHYHFNWEIISNDHKTQRTTSNMHTISHTGNIDTFLGSFAKLRKATVSFVMLSVCPSVCRHGTTRLPLGGISGCLVFDYFSKTCRQNSSFVKIWERRKGYLTSRPVYFYHDISSWILLRMINVSDRTYLLHGAESFLRS